MITKSILMVRVCPACPALPPQQIHWMHGIRLTSRKDYLKSKINSWLKLSDYVSEVLLHEVLPLAKRRA